MGDRGGRGLQVSTLAGNRETVMTRYLRTLALRRALREKKLLERAAREAHESGPHDPMRVMFEQRTGTSELVGDFDRFQLAFFREREGE